MAPTTTCPDPARLECFVLGNVGETEAESLELHLAECPKCLGVLQRLPVEDDLTAVMRAQSQNPLRFPVNEHVQDLMRGAREMNSRALTPPPGDGATTAQDPGPVGAFLAPPHHPGELGRLGPYGVTRILGEGGMGVVLAAEDPQLDRRVALKVLRPALAASASAHKRFLREARSVAALDHEHVVRVYHVGEDRGLPYFAMQLLEGETLEARLTRGPLPVPEVARLGAELAEGLAAAHARGLLHRDVKPANVFLERVQDEGAQGARDRVRLVDFGLAWVADGETALTGHDVVLGTPPYMAPEQARGEKANARSDLFSLGSVLYAMASGRPPFQAETTYATLQQVSAAAPTPLAELDPSLPGWLTGLVNHLHARAAEDRPSSAAEVAALLRAHLVGPGQLAQAPAPPPPAAHRACDPQARAHLARQGCGSGVPGGPRRAWPGRGGRHDRLAPTPRSDPCRSERHEWHKGPTSRGRAKGRSVGEAGWGAEGPGGVPGGAVPVRGPGGSRPGRQGHGPPARPAGRRPRVAAGGPRRPEEGPARAGTQHLRGRQDRRGLPHRPVHRRQTPHQRDRSPGGQEDLPRGPHRGHRNQRPDGGVGRRQGRRRTGPAGGPTRPEGRRSHFQEGRHPGGQAREPQDRLAALGKALGQAKRPRVRVEIGERHVGGVRIDPAAQTEVMYYARESGFTVIDPEEGLRADADVIIRGEGLSETASRHGNLVAVKARVEVRAVERRTGRVLAVDRQTTVAVDLTEQLAGKAALQEAAARLAERLLPKIVTK